MSVRVAQPFLDSTERGSLMTDRELLARAKGYSPILEQELPTTDTMPQTVSVEALRQVIENSSNDHSSLMGNYRGLLKTHQESQEKTQALMRNYEQLEAEQKQLFQSHAELKEQTQKIQKELSTSEEKHHKLEEEHLILQQRCDSLSLRLSEIEKQKKEVEVALDTSTAYVTDLKSKIETLAQQIEGEQQQRANLEADLSKVRKKLSGSQIDLRRSTVRIHTLSQDLKSANQQRSVIQHSLEQSQVSLDAQKRENQYFQFIPSLSEKIWTSIISNPCNQIDRPILLAAYLISALFRYAIYKLYSRVYLRNELEQTYQSNLDSVSFQQAALLIENRVIQKFTGRHVTVQRAL